MLKAPTKLFYEFGDFRLDAQKHRLLRDGEIVPLTPKAVETLRVLVERPGRLVERDELMNSVWQSVAVEDGNLTVTISMLRKALGEDAKGRKFIETVPRLGYKFVAKVHEVVEEVSGFVVEKQTSGRIVIDEEIAIITKGSGGVSPLLSSSRRIAMATAITALIVVAVAALAYFSHWQSNPASAAPANIRSIAVLPFRTVNSGKENAHEGLGMADILITRLSNIHAINVRPISAVMSFENQHEDSLSIAGQLRVDAVLEGSIYRAGDKVRVTGRLIKVSDQKVLWSGQFERQTRDELQLQNEIALQVVDALALHLSRQEEGALTKHYTESADAYQLYLKGRYEWNKRSFGGLSKAQHLFRNAIEIDPGFALAYVGLADSQVFASTTPELDSAIAKALELDPNSAEAYATQGFHLTVHHWDWKGAEESFNNSIALNPGYPTAHHWYAVLLSIQGRNEEAKAEMQHALEINPLSYNLLADMGQIYYFNREYDQAKEYCRKALEIYPDFSYAHVYLREIFLQTGEYEAVIGESVKAEIALGQVSNQPANLAQSRLSNFAGQQESYRRGGITKFLESRMAESQKDNASQNHQNAPYEYARTYAFLGNKEKALDNLEKAFENRAYLLAWVKADPIFDSLRSEPRYRAILKKMGL